MKNKSLTPQIRFKGYDDEWSLKSLSESEFDIQAGGDIDKTILKSSGRYPVIANALVGEGILGYYDNYFRIKAPAVSITGRGDVGIAVPRRENFTPVVRLLALTSPNDIDFLSCAINLHPKVLESTGVPQLTVPKLQSYCICFPKLSEQEAIGNYFRLIDEMINEAEREISRLEKMKQASLQKMFPRSDAKIPEIRFGGFAESWSSDVLGNLASIYQPKTISQDQLLPYGYPVYGANGMIGYYSDYNHAKPQIAITCRGNTCGTVNFTMPKSWITGNAMVVNLDDSTLEKDFVYYYLQSRDMTALISGSGQPQITRKPIAEFPIIYPQDMCEQKAIGQYFRNIDSLLAEKRRKLVKLRNIKQACLDKMFVNTYDL